MQGFSGVRLEMIDRLVRFVNAGATPIVRELGSIGASGDLVPLSTIARAITGQTNFVKVQLGGQELDGTAALRELKLEPLELQPKEGLAIVNGTAPFAPQSTRWNTINEVDVRRIIGDLVSFPRRRNSDPVAPWIEALSLIRLGLVAPADAEARYDGDVEGLVLPPTDGSVSDEEGDVLHPHVIERLARARRQFSDAFD